MATIRATCAHRQDRFLDMREYLFARQTALAETDWVLASVELGLDPARFEHCLSEVRPEEIDAVPDRPARRRWRSSS